MARLIPEQLRAQVLRWKQRRGWGSERIFAIRTDFPYEGASDLDCDGLRVKVVPCRSDLEARDQLLGLENDDDRGLLLLVRAREDCLGEDVVARFAGRQLQTLDQREVLKEIYQASAIDPRISNDEALLDALVMAGSSGNERKAPGGVLDLDFAWSVLLRQPELMNQRPDLVEILKWSLDGPRWAAVEALDAKLLPGFFQWVGERAGAVSRCLDGLHASGQSNLFVPLGLVAGDLLHERFDALEVAKDARVRLENYLNGVTLRPADAAVWKRAAGEALATRSRDDLERVAGEIDSILTGIRATGIAEGFGHSKLGFKHRWVAFSEDIDRLGNRKWETGSRALHDSLVALQKHALAPLNKARLRRAEMAARLAACEANIVATADAPKSLASAMRAFADHDSYVDWARFSLSWGDPLPEVTKVYAKLARRWTKLRVEAQARMGERLCQWHADNEASGSGFVPLESAVAECVAPLAREHPVLLLVMDGMGFPAFHQLSTSLEGSGWSAQSREGTAFPTPALSVLPSVTDVSRRALFAGTVRSDGKTTETVAFREHPALADLPGKGKPLLFTKKDLGSEDSAALSPKVRDALAGNEHRVVAVVINAIDDQLKTGGQLSMEWTVSGIGILPAILEAAKEGNRAIVMTSDHGHIPEMENTKAVETASTGEARYRHGQASDENERTFRGNRIEAAVGAPSVILAVTETIRYGQKAGGYHGGACDLEALVPLAVFAAPDDEIPGWEAVDVPRPPWWDWRALLLGDGSVAPSVKRKPRQAKKVDIADELPLFDLLKPGKTEEGECPWLAALLSSEVFAEQERLLGRAGPNREHLTKVLAALDANGGTLMVSAIARAIGEPTFRIQGILTRVARFMNVDGYEVIALDPESGTVRLHGKTLAAQFQITL